MLTLKQSPIFALFSGSLFSINDELPLNKKKWNISSPFFSFLFIMTISRSGNLNNSNNKKERPDQSLQTIKFNYPTHFSKRECFLNFQSFKFLMFVRKSFQAELPNQSLDLQWNNATRQFLQIIYV